MYVNVPFLLSNIFAQIFLSFNKPIFIYITVCLVNDQNMTVYEKENDSLTGLYVQISVIPLYVETANPSMQKKKQKQKPQNT